MAATSETRVFGATGKDAPSWEDTNMALFGSDIEKKIKEAAAGGEAEWQGVGEKKGVLVWRIEQFRVVPWPETKYGEFHVGDSYIALHTYQPSPANPSLAWDIHFWIGNESTQDEYGTAAYKTTELGDYLGHGKARHYREVQGRESRRFLKLFGMKLKYLQGGVESGFRHVDHSREAVLLRVKGRGARNVILTQVRDLRSNSVPSHPPAPLLTPHGRSSARAGGLQTVADELGRCVPPGLHRGCLHVDGLGGQRVGEAPGGGGRAGDATARGRQP